MSYIPILSIAGLNVEDNKKNFIKDLMLKSIKSKISIDIEIIPDPNNSYDANAIKIVMNGVAVGYVAKVDQKYFDFSQNQKYIANIVSWGVLKDSSVYVYIQPILFS